MTSLSVGRGTDTPFEIIGAPWIDGRKLADSLNAAGLMGVSFVAKDFTPASSKYKGESCGGVMMVITNRDRVRSLDLGFEIARQLRTLYGEKWQTKELNRLLGHKQVAETILRGAPLGEIKSEYADRAKEFATRRDKYLIYR